MYYEFNEQNIYFLKAQGTIKNTLGLKEVIKIFKEFTLYRLCSWILTAIFQAKFCSYLADNFSLPNILSQ